MKYLLYFYIVKQKHIPMEMYLVFTLDYNGQCENIDDFDIDNVSHIDDLSYESIDNYVEKLKTLKKFKISEHRTEVTIMVNDDTMEVRGQYYKSPDWENFSTFQFETTTIPFDWEEVE